MTEVNYICESCKSENILFDAYATWNANKQNFSMTQCFGVGGNIVCNQCGHESTHADEVSYIPEVKTIEVPICSSCGSDNIEVWQPTQFDQETGEWIILDGGLPEVHCQSEECEGGDIKNDYDTKTISRENN